MHKPVEAAPKAENSAILRVDSVAGIGEVFVFTDKWARDSYGVHVIPEGFEDSGSFVEPETDDNGNPVFLEEWDAELDEFTIVSVNVRRYWGRK